MVTSTRDCDLEEYYHYPQEVWDEAKCEKERRRVWKDGLGTPGPKGIVQSSGAAVSYYGKQRFNGGTVIDGKWYPGYYRPFPKLAEGYAYHSHPAWGRLIVKEGTTWND